MNDLKDLFYTILVCSISGTIAGAVVLLFRRLTEKFISPSWKCILWAIPLLLLLIPFRIPLNLGSADAVQLWNNAAISNIKGLPDYFNSDANAQKARIPKQGSGIQEQSSGIQKQATDSGSQSANTSQTTQIETGQLPTSLQQGVPSVDNQPAKLDMIPFILEDMIPLAWLIGLAAMLVFLLFGSIRLHRGINRTSIEAADEKIMQIVNRCCEIIKLKKPLKVTIQSYIKTSALVGMFHPTIVLPAYVTGLDEETLKYIILHELSHYKRRDMIMNYLLILVQAVHWFNPFVWYCFKNIRQDMELATDAMVLSHLQNPEHKQYALSLLKIVGTEQGIEAAPKMLCMVDSPKNIRRRINMIKLNGFFKKRPVLIALSCILVMALAGTVFFTVKPDAAGGSNIKLPGSTVNSSQNSSDNLNQVPSLSPENKEIHLSDQPADTASDSGSPASTQYASLYFLDDSNGWVAQGSAGFDKVFRLLATTNGGKNWTVVYNGALEFMNLNFINRQVGWGVVRTNNSLYSIEKTTDGGKTWVNQKQYTFTDNGNTNTKIRFFDLNSGYSLICDKLLKTSDGGNTWTDITPSDGFVLTDCSFVSNAVCWVCGIADGNIAAFYTADGGASWTEKFKLTRADTDLTAPLKIEFIDETTGWILLDNTSVGSSKPTLYKTSDGGNSFIGICNVTNTRPYPTDICFTDSDTGFAGTDHGAGPIPGGLMMTTDGGKTFSNLFSNIGGIYSIVFPSQKVGYALGYNDTNMSGTGFIIGTTDGGKSWHQLSIIAPAIGISFIDGRNGYGLGTGFDSGAFLKTTDGGESWSYVYSFSPKCLYTAGISFVSETTGFVIAGPPDGDSMENDLYKTEDGGKSWIKAGKVSFYCDYFKMFDENNGIASGLTAGSVTYSKTADGGKTWTPVPINANGDNAIVSAFSSPEQGIVTSFDYQDQTVTFKKFSDGNIGNTIAACPDTEIGCSGISIAGSKVIALMCMGHSSGYYEAMIVSDDGGAAWKQIPLSANTGDILLQIINHGKGQFMDFPNSKDGFIMVPGYSSLLCTTDGGNSWKWR